MEISSGEFDYKKDYTEIKFNYDDKLPLNKPLKFHNMTITINLFLKTNFIHTFFQMILCMH